MKTSTQLKALVRNLAKEKNVEAEIILRNFMFERLLERIAISEHRERFILKGGMLIAAMVGIDTRTTMDLDATINARSMTEKDIVSFVTDILNVSLDDGVSLTFQGVEAIHEEADYPGYRVSIDAVLDKTRQRLKLDVTAGDYVTPRAIEYDFKLMFQDRTIRLMAYNLETVLAEKFESTITRGVANTRMRDFYDIYILTRTYSLDADIFRAAAKKTSEKRHTTSQMQNPGKVIQAIADSEIMAELWTRYQKKYSYATDISWELVIDAVRVLIEQLTEDKKG